MNDVVRFPAQIPYDDSEPCLEVFAAMVAGDWALAKQRYDANPTATSNTMGAVRYWRDLYVEPPPAQVVELSPPALSVIGKTPWEMRAPGVFYAIQVSIPGRILAVIESGGDGVWGHVSDSPYGAPLPWPEDGHTSWGAGSCGWLDIAPGQWFTFVHQAADAKTMRMDLNPPN